MAQDRFAEAEQSYQRAVSLIPEMIPAAGSARARRTEAVRRSCRGYQRSIALVPARPRPIGDWRELTDAQNMVWKHSPSTGSRCGSTLAERAAPENGAAVSATARAMRRPPSTKLARERIRKMRRPPHAGGMYGRDVANGRRTGRCGRHSTLSPRVSTKCCGKLRYHAPTLVAEAVAIWPALPRRDWMLLDAGCGTGLCGVGLRHAAVSSGWTVTEMVKRRPSGLYDPLTEPAGCVSRYGARELRP